jgi:uncharacterized protein (TIGR02246 family)
MTTDATGVASTWYAAIEKAWNAAEGAAFAAQFVDDLLFVDIRGVRHDGSREHLAAGHQAIFDSIYKGSVIAYELETARVLTDGVILARGQATLDTPAGPMAGIHLARNTVVLVRDGEDWRGVAFHNTLVTA